MDDALLTIYTAHVTINKLRHDHALAESKFDHAVIFSGALHYQFLDDMSYPFKVNPHFKAWVPVTDNPNCFVVYTPNVKPKLIFFAPVDYWHKVATRPTDKWVEKFDLVTIANPDDAKQYMPAGRTAFIGEWDERFATWGDLTPNPEQVMNSLHWDRAKKTEYELECLRRANVRSVKGHLAAERAFREGLSEFEIHFQYLRAANHVEEEVPYGNIIACNDHASTLHYYHHDRTEYDKTHLHSFLIDAGAQCYGYASDITRTYSRQKDEFQDLIEAMDVMQLDLVAACRPNVNYIDLHLDAHQKVAEILLRFGFVRDLSVEATVTTGVSSTFFPHGLGHFLGLQVHDVGGFMANRSGDSIPKPPGHPHLRLTRVVDTGMCFTIEPGLYFIETLLADLQKTDNAKYIDWTKVDAFRKFGGIRIEDDIVITENGHDNLTRAAFAELS
ncbi:MAG TPA: Xaa-Pro dipeptidase [Thermoanaerobaculia bacterium]|jgi:Xaa-Pro dipeptidase|nr:Xaa-Pro dipeptidase [Thermoanaerobaculia bacterium]